MGGCHCLWHDAASRDEAGYGGGGGLWGKEERGRRSSSG